MTKYKDTKEEKQLNKLSNAYQKKIKEYSNTRLIFYKLIDKLLEIDTSDKVTYMNLKKRFDNLFDFTDNGSAKKRSAKKARSAPVFRKLTLAKKKAMSANGLLTDSAKNKLYNKWAKNGLARVARGSAPKSPAKSPAKSPSKSPSKSKSKSKSSTIESLNVSIASSGKSQSHPPGSVEFSESPEIIGK